MEVQQLDRRVEQVVHVAGPDVAAVVDEDVDAAPLAQDRGDPRRERCTIRQIHDHRKRASPLAREPNRRERGRSRLHGWRERDGGTVRAL